MARLKTISTRTHERKVYSVSELNRSAKQVLEGQFFQVWVEAEMSNLTLARSGHWYFTLKDDHCQVSCAMFRGSNGRTRVKPADGIKVLVKGKVSLYEPRGSYQLIVDHMELAGVGDLLARFEELKTRLQAEGLFSPERKRQIDQFNKRIGVITSATGAAIHDVLSTIERRFPLQQVILYPSLVQGKEAVASLRQQLAIANQRNEVDVLLLVRGGGAIEDLWSFNDEALARDIAASQIPVVSGVGHESDVTICDFVADLRAATPTAAAEHTTPDQYKLLQDIQANRDWLKATIKDRILRFSQQVDWLTRQLASPERLVQHHRQSILILTGQLSAAYREHLNDLTRRIQALRFRLHQQEPVKQIQASLSRNEHHRLSLFHLIKERLAMARAALAQQAVQLDNLSPLKVLSRGYSVTYSEDGRLLHKATEVQTGDTIVSRLGEGKIISQVKQLKD